MTGPFPQPNPFPAGVIESGISPLVEALNATRWVRTTSSCAGHQDREILTRPLVAFVTCERIAKAVHWVLRQRADGRLCYHWRLSGRFVMPGGALQLAWHLEPDPVLAQTWERAGMNSDILALAGILPEPIVQAGTTGSLAFLGFPRRNFKQLGRESE